MAARITESCPAVDLRRRPAPLNRNFPHLSNIHSLPKGAVRDEATHRPPLRKRNGSYFDYQKANASLLTVRQDKTLTADVSADKMPQYHGVVFRSTNEIDYHQRPGGRGKLLDGSSSLTQTSWGKQPGVRYNDPTWQTAVHLSVSKQCEDYNDPYVAIVPHTPNMVIGGTKRARSEDEDEMMERPVRAKSRRLWQQYGEKNVHLGLGGARAPKGAARKYSTTRRKYFKCHDAKCEARLVVDITVITGNVLKSDMQGKHNHPVQFAMQQDAPVIGPTGNAQVTADVLTAAPQPKSATQSTAPTQPTADTIPPCYRHPSVQYAGATAAVQKAQSILRNAPAVQVPHLRPQTVDTHGLWAQPGMPNQVSLEPEDFDEPINDEPINDEPINDEPDDEPINMQAFEEKSARLCSRAFQTQPEANLPTCSQTKASPEVVLKSPEVVLKSPQVVVQKLPQQTSQLLQKDALLRIANQAAQQAVETAMAFGLSEADFSSQLGLVHLLCSMNSDANNTENAQIP